MTDATQITFTQSGTGAVARTVQLKLQEFISVKDFGAVGDGITDDTAAINRAITAAQNLNNSVAINLNNGIYGITSLTLNAATKIIGNGATLKILSGTGPAITIPDGTPLQVSGYCLLQGFIIDGGLTNPSTLGTPYLTGLKINNHAAVILDTIHIINCNVGFYFEGAQFCTTYSLKAYNNGVGIYVKNTIGNGGGNSISFYDSQCIGNRVGFLTNNVTANFPHHALYLWNNTMNGNSICALAVIGANNNLTEINVIGGTSEASGGGSATFAFDGLTIKKSMVYCSFAYLRFRSQFISEASVNPAFTLENQSRLVLSDVCGYGNPQGKFCQTDSTSGVLADGVIDTVGSIQGIIGWNSTTGNVAPFARVLPANTFVTTTIPNEFNSPATPSFSDTNGTISNGFGRNAIFGQFFYVQFSPTPSNGQTNRARLVINSLSGGRVCIAFNLLSNIDTVLTVNIYSNLGTEFIQLRAGIAVRVAYVYDGIPAGVSNLIFGPTDTAGATVQFSQFHQISGSYTPQLQAQMNAIISGAYNPGINLLKSNDQRSTPPSSGTWSNGDVVWNSAPSPGGFIGWVCVTAGTPGTWKGFGAISA